MKKTIKTTLITISILISIILLDTLQAIIFKTSPALSLREILGDNTSYIDKGILINTFYCTKEQDIVTISHQSKTSKFACPIDKVYELNNAKGVSMTIKEGTLTDTGATIIIKDISNKNNTFGEEYRIDKYVNNEWQELDVVVKGNYGWNDIGYHIDKNNKLELTINWEWLYGKLEKGKYRLVKKSLDTQNKKHTFSVEFEIK
jgi:hypothetical protein